MAKKRKTRKQKEQGQARNADVSPQERVDKQRVSHSKAARRQAKQDATKRKQLRNWVILGLIGVAALAAVIFRPQPVVIEEAIAERPFKGSADAPVVLTEYADFHCHGCEGWHKSGIIDQIIEQFGEENVRYEFSHFPQFSPALAAAAECANDQNAFWPFHDLLFDNFPAQMADLNGYAAQSGMEVAIFEECVDSGKYEGTVYEMLSFARVSGFRGTPSFQVNGETVPTDPNSIIAAIEAELASSN